MKLAYLFVVALLFPTWMVAQKPEISFKSEVHDYGKIKEAAGAAACTFTFTNTGNAPLLITGVTASCGCTTPDWTKSPILPGKTGTIKASYDATGRPGPFDKTITVNSNAAKNSSVVLRIKGDVEAKVLTIQEQYPAAAGNLRLKSGVLQMGRVPNNGNKTETLEVYNNGTTPLIISFDKVPAHITMVAEPTSLGAKQKGTIKCTYNGLRKNELGPVADEIQVKAGNDRVSLKINGTIEEDFSKLTPDQLKKAPKLSIKNMNYNFGTIKNTAKHKGVFEVTNTGLSDLIIRKVATSCLCLRAAVSQNITIKPGKSTNLEFELTAASQMGDQNYVITLVANTPAQTQYNLYFSGTVTN